MVSGLNGEKVEKIFLYKGNRNSYYISMKTSVSEKGQITIPKKIRNAMSLIPGTILEISVVNGKIIAQKSQNEMVKGRWRGKGKLPNNLSVDTYLRKVRDSGE